MQDLHAAGCVISEGRIKHETGSLTLQGKAITRLRILAGDIPARSGKISLALPGLNRKPAIRVEALDRNAGYPVSDSVVVAAETVSGVDGDTVGCL